MDFKFLLLDKKIKLNRYKEGFYSILKNFLTTLLFVIITLIYWFTGSQIENRSESEDIYEYAIMVDNGPAHDWFFHKHHLFFGSFVKFSYSITSSVFDNLAILDFMRIFSSVFASGTLFFFFLYCYKRYSLRPISSILATMCFGLMYGFWRYSAEAEIPIIATFFMMVAIYFSTDLSTSKKNITLGLFFSFLSVLMHIMNIVAVFIAIPAFFIIHRRYKICILHLVFNTIFIFLAYLFTNQFNELFTSSSLLLNSNGLTITGQFTKGIIGFLQCIISFDFVLGFSSVRAFLSELFAHRMLLEEFYFGERISRLHIFISLITFLSLFSISVYIFFRSIWIWKNNIIDREKLLLPEGRIAFLIPVIFFLGYALLILFIEPGNPELWVMGLMPFSLLLCGLIIVPMTYDNKLWLPLLAILFLGLHNFIAIKALSDSSMDYNQVKAAFIMNITNKDDVVFTAGSPVFERYLRYHSNCEVLYLYNYSEEEFLSIIKNKNKNKKIYFLGDIFNQESSMFIRFPAQTKRITEIGKNLINKNKIHLVLDDNFGGIYKLK